uniref:Transposase IS110-like N-terminal domain-containing protein n=1 Tax=Rhodococcus sp. NS1 TaxID=402236 RepID=A0A097SQX6_9NOCA|nr:hypothetical protein LRS1606.476 [Rhodococcus sp. NS1]
MGGGVGGRRLHSVRGESVAGGPFPEHSGVSGAKSDAADAHVLADMVRTDSHQLRPVAGDSAEAEAIKVLARAHKTLIFRTHPPDPVAAARAARVLPGRVGGVRRPRCRRYPRAAREGAGPGLDGATDTRSDHRGATGRPPPRHRDQDRSDPGRAAR